MADPEQGDGAARPVQIRDFIFVRELAEVYLLLDFISGRWDKHLEPRVKDLIKDICEIGWPPEDDNKSSPASQASQAAILLKAKDMLNAAARPANGATIAFTLLVVGEDDPRQQKGGKQHERRGSGSAAAPPPDPGGSWLGAVRERLGLGARPPGGRRDGESGNGWPGNKAAGGNGDLIAPGRGFARPPTRMSLARTAFPGLIGPAVKFNRDILRIVVVLVIWLVVTCLLSWNVTAGNVILSHLDTLRTQQQELRRKVADAEVKLAADELARQAKTQPRAPAAAPPAPPLYAYCDPARADRTATLAQTYRGVEEYHLCKQAELLERELNGTWRNLNAWLQPWRRLYYRIVNALDFLLGPLAQGARPARQDSDDETARILTLVLGSAVLPLFYGILGAGAAVVRDLWRKMRESVLSPRDYTLALGQLALGATIGACIGLFVNASGTTTNGQMLAGTLTLSGSALSFIAGFGVEGVFLAMETFVRRVFNVPDPTRPAP
ncbi:hypothetical protein [Pseudoduganella namucuonensis]|uniref:Uncharacterized protein n=1 Tax=Pseudoduganella namucuonensis TaxID=1035707 RepID=A0A1I7JH85_9BURK|nr:hypothetical protein [Pseudoduganella namucuonensis]SFU84544.1 hypothetical protein SAMN05216552_1011140 [Pseudoduganella namucuonensis]